VRETRGIGNGVVQAFRSKGTEVHVWGTRGSAADHDPAEGSNLQGLNYACLEVMDFVWLDAYRPPFEGLEILLTCQGQIA
jgi:3-oxoacyl-[acyl-carrier protein] reductase